jgi:hypothetical protein
LASTCVAKRLLLAPKDFVLEERYQVSERATPEKESRFLKVPLYALNCCAEVISAA